MMGSNDHKKLATVIVASLGKHAGESDEGSDKGVDYDSASEEILSAIKDGDPKALTEALKSFYEMCESEEHDDGEDKTED